jgi:hypothetical protein
VCYNTLLNTDIKTFQALTYTFYVYLRILTFSILGDETSRVALRPN